MTRRMGRYATVILGALISTGFLWWLASLVDWRAFADQVPDGALGTLAASSAIYVVTLALRAFRFSWLFSRVADERVPIFAAFDLVSLNNLLNHLLPLRAGEIAFLSLARSLHGVSVSISTLVLFTARLGDLAGLLIGMSVFSWMVSIPDEARFAIAGLAVIAVVALLKVELMVRIGRRVLAWLSGRFLPEKLSAKVQGIFDKLDDVAHHLKSPWVAVGNIVAACAIWLVNSVFFYVVVQIIGFSVTFAQVFIGGSGAALLPSLPINAFGSLGTLEAGWTAGFVLVGIEASAASASGFVLHGVILFCSTITGAWAALRVGSALGWRREKLEEPSAPTG